VIQTFPVPDLPLYLGVVKQRAPLARPIFLPKIKLRWIFAYVVQF